MKTTKIAAISAVSVFAMVALLVAYPAMAATQAASLSPVPLTGTSLASTSTGSTTIIPTPTALTPGQTITFTSTSGKYVEIGNRSVTGIASGVVTFTVTAAFKAGYALSISSGSLAFNPITPVSSTTSTTTVSNPITIVYPIASGSAEMGPHQAHLVGQGLTTASTANGAGSFLVAAGAHANFDGKTYNTLRFDINVGGTQYGVVLLVTATIA